MYQAGVEWILGIRREGGRLLLKPRIPAGWPGFKAEYRFGGSVYAIEVIGRQAGRNGPGLTVDGKPVPAEAGRAGDGGGGPAKAGRADGGPAAGAPKPAAANGGAAAGRDAASAGSAAVRTDAVGSAVAQPPDFAGSDYSRGAVAPVNAPAGWYVDLVDDGARHEVVLQL
jgi:hypothetical protein